jgi:hypothetical protein
MIILSNEYDYPDMRNNEFIGKFCRQFYARVSRWW